MLLGVLPSWQWPDLVAISPPLAQEDVFPSRHRAHCARPPPPAPSPWDPEGFGTVWPPLGHGGDAGVPNARKPALTPMPH